MRLKESQNNALHDNFDQELRIQQLLLRAKEAAARELVAYFEQPKNNDDTRIPATIKAAMQFTARPMPSMQAVIRNENRAAIAADARQTVEQPATPVSAATPTQSHHQPPASINPTPAPQPLDSREHDIAQAKLFEKKLELDRLKQLRRGQDRQQP